MHPGTGWCDITSSPVFTALLRGKLPSAPSPDFDFAQSPLEEGLPGRRGGPVGA
ncbi:MAG TPA: hypothetical protein PLH09_04445 [Lentimicrobium sp.]|nr:hypothetical protein [Lentimicrobium sp.]